MVPRIGLSSAALGAMRQLAAHGRRLGLAGRCIRLRITVLGPRRSRWRGMRFNGKRRAERGHQVRASART